MSLELASSNKVFGGELRKYSFVSQVLGGLKANLNVFLPPNPTPASASPAPVLFYLAGLTCTEDNGAQKAGFHQAAAEERIAIVYPDTSPRGANIAGEDESYDFGSGAGFYINASKEPWSKNYRMYDHVTKELPQVLKASGLPLDLSRTSIFGHSMGGHGALTLYLREPSLYRSASAFAPICHPTACPWGEKAFGGYLTDGIEGGKQHDAVELLRAGAGAKRGRLDVLVDSGTADNFYKQGQLLPEHLVDAARQKGYGEDQVRVRLQEGYDHSYYFISTFGPEHVRFHAKFLHQK